MREEEPPYSFKKLLKDIWKFVAGYRISIFFFTSLILAANLIPFYNIYLIGKIIDFFTNYSVGSSLRPFYLMLALVVGTNLLQTLVRVSARFRVRSIGSELRMKARINTMKKLVDLPLSWHENQATGAKTQKIQTGSESLYRAASFFSFEGGEILVSLLGGLLIFFVLDWKYALFSILYAGGYIFAERYFNKKVEHWEEQLNLIKEKVSGKMHESVSNIVTVQSLGLKKSFQDTTSQQEKRYHQIWMNHKKVALNKTRIIRTLAALGYGIFFLMVGFDVAKGAITVGSIIVFTSYFSRLREGLERLSDSFVTIIEIKIGIKRLLSFLDLQTDDRNAKHLLDVHYNWKSISFENVTFRYKDREVLKNFNLTIRRGEQMGVVGGSGEGKSTLAKLLLGLYHPQKGSIQIDGIDISKYKHSSLLKAVSIVLQDAEVFNLSLAENIKIADPQNKRDLGDITHMADLEGLIKRLPQGVKTLVGEKGYKLSGGERQRMGLARALYKRSSLLILDEATSHLDSKTESIIQENLKRLKDKTIITIAHRLSTLKNTNRIIVLDQGRIIEEGSFQELLKKRGRFYQYYRHQQQK